MSHPSVEQLNKTQLILLALFIAFVTSIASAIITVTLMEQAPPGVTQTINRIVEKTVEVAVPGKTIVERVREVPVIVTQEDLVTDVVKNALPSVLVIIDPGDVIIPVEEAKVGVDTTALKTAIIASTSVDNDVFPRVGQKVLGMGFIISGEGLVITSGGLPLLKDTKYIVRQLIEKDGKEWEAILQDKGDGFQVMKITNLGKNEIPPYLSMAEGEPRLGKTAVALGGDGKMMAVAVGIVSSFQHGDENELPQVSTTLSVGKESIGAPLLNLNGQVIGIMEKGDEAVGIEPIIRFLKAKTTFPIVP